MAIIIESGWLNGHAIRKARKPYKCEYWRGSKNGGVCAKPIPVGSYYVEGELIGGETGRNGVLLQHKYCPECAGEDALAAIAKAEGRS